MYFVLNFAQNHRVRVGLKSVTTMKYNVYHWSRHNHVFVKNSFDSDQRVVLRQPRPIARTMTPAYK